LVNRFVDAVVFEVGFGAGIEHQAIDTLFGQDVGRHAAGVAGTYEKDVIFFRWHGSAFVYGIDRIDVGTAPATTESASAASGRGAGGRPLARVLRSRTDIAMC